MNTKLWVGSLISTISGAVGGVIAPVMLDPEKFNFNSGLRNIAIACAIPAGVAVLNFLKKSPLPGVDIQAPVEGNQDSGQKKFAPGALLGQRPQDAFPPVEGERHHKTNNPHEHDSVKDDYRRLYGAQRLPIDGQKAP